MLRLHWCAAASVAFVLLCSSGALAGGPDTLWTKTYGGPYYDEGTSIQETSDGGLVFTGYKEIFIAGLPARQIYLVRTDADGDTLWTRLYGGLGWHFGNSVQQTFDGGFIVAGATSDYSMVADAVLMKTDGDGIFLWGKTFGGADYEEALTVRQTGDGGYVVAGFSETLGGGLADVHLIRTDARGDTLWTRAYGGPLWDEGHCVRETSDGGFIVAGYSTLTSSPSGPDTQVYLIKTDVGGDTLWTRLYGGEYRDEGWCVEETSDGGFAVVGEAWYPGTPAWEIDFYLVKTDQNGDSVWTRTYDASQGSDIGRFIQQTPDGGYIMTGYAQIPGIYDMYVVRTDADGDTLWTKTIGSHDAATPWEEAWALDRTSDGGYAIVGWTLSQGLGGRDAYLVKLAPDVLTLSGHLAGSELVLDWTAWPGASLYWVCGASNHAYFLPGFAPGYQHRLAVVSPLVRTWSSGNGVGDPDSNWTYMILAVDAGEQELGRSNRFGEHDFAP
jgi:hypothetical protein